MNLGAPPTVPTSNTSTNSSQVTPARDPIVKHGPEGIILPGRKLDYRIQLENEGETTAFGVYFTDTLDDALDDSAPDIGPVIRTNDGLQIAPAGTYDPETRTVTWLVGEVGPHEGGYAHFSVNVRSDAPESTRRLCAVCWRNLSGFLSSSSISEIRPVPRGLQPRRKRGACHRRNPPYSNLVSPGIATGYVPSGPSLTGGSISSRHSSGFGG